MKKIKNWMQMIKSLYQYFGFRFATQCLIRRMISFSLYEKYVYNYLNRFFEPITKKLDENSVGIVKTYPQKPVTVWTLWWQGELSAPELVKVCLDSQREAFKPLGIQVVVLTQENWKKYISLPKHILNKVSSGTITLTHFSDIIRAELLRKYGGIWIDATVYCTKPVPASILQRDFFTVKTCEKSDALTRRRWTGFLMGGKPGMLLFNYMTEAFHYYWRTKNALAAYLLIDFVIAIAYERFPSVKEKIDQVEVSNPELRSMLRNLNKEYEQEEWEKLTAETVFLKLSYKSEFNGGELRQKTPEGRLTYWGKLSMDNMKQYYADIRSRSLS